MSASAVVRAPRQNAPAGRALRSNTIVRVSDPRSIRKFTLRTAIPSAFALLGTLGAVAMSITVRPVLTPSLAIFAFMFALVGTGITVGFHRLLSHRSFKTPAPLRAVLAVLGSAAGQGSPDSWVAVHRIHHANSDRDGDPHSPRHEPGFRNYVRAMLHAHAGWIFKYTLPDPAIYARDLLADEAVAWVIDRYWLWFALGLLLPAMLGLLVTRSLYGALEALLWGGFVRTFVHHNLIMSIASLSHSVGHRDYDAGDLSTNNIWFAIPTFGESLHNTHHAFPRAAIFATHWWECDIGGGIVYLLERCRLATDVGRPIRRSRRSSALTVADTPRPPEREAR